jgi:hypothetical protein
MPGPYSVLNGLGLGEEAAAAISWPAIALAYAMQRPDVTVVRFANDAVRYPASGNVAGAPFRAQTVTVTGYSGS